MAFVSAQGIATPIPEDDEPDEDGEPYAAFGNRVPALRGFRLTFPSGRDREIVLIQVLAGGTAQDVSPNAQGQPTNFPDGQLHVRLQDADPAGESFGFNVSHSVLRNSGARRYQIRDVGCAGACTRKLPAQVMGGGFPNPAPPGGLKPVIALVGFKLFFTGAREHELDRVGVWFTGDELNLALRDESVGLTDTFGYLVDFVVIPTVGLNVTRGIERGSARGLETVPFPTPSRADFVLTGWAFNFRPGDREILDIGVLRSSNAFTVFYADNGGGEEFDWRVEWAHIAPMVFQE